MDPAPKCHLGDHPAETGIADAAPAALDRAARILRALGDLSRLQLLQVLTGGERCVTELVAGMGEKFSTVSQRLRVLRAEGLVVRRRAGVHLYYALADRHVADLVSNALAHAMELEVGRAHRPGLVREAEKGGMTLATLHANHTHKHGPNCGHTAVKHDGHVDYLHDGHLHHVGKEGVEEHTLAVSGANPATCTPKHACKGHDKGHKHGTKCGHDAVPHGDHVDYLVEGHLHHPHGDHCDDHGPIHKA